MENKYSTKVVVVPIEFLPEAKNKVLSQIPNFVEIVTQYGIDKIRGDVEEDPNFRQVIPYAIFKYQDRFFLMKRTAVADHRLKYKYSLGVGGHIDKSEVSESILEWGKREIEEEIIYEGNLKASLLGLINDNSTPENQVHIGVVILLESDSDKVEIKDKNELASGELETLEEIKEIYPDLETWSQFIFDYLSA